MMKLLHDFVPFYSQWKPENWVLLPATYPTSQKHLVNVCAAKLLQSGLFPNNFAGVRFLVRPSLTHMDQEGSTGWDLWWSDYCSGLLRNLSNWTTNRPSVRHSVVLALNLKCSHGDGGQFVEQQAWNRTGDSSVSLFRGQGLPRWAKVRGFDFLIPSSWGCSSDLWPCW